MQIRPEPRGITHRAQPSLSPADHAGGGLTGHLLLRSPFLPPRILLVHVEYFLFKTDLDKAESLAVNFLPELTFSDAVLLFGRPLRVS